MKKHVLVNNSSKYNGLFVATASFTDTHMQNSGDNPVEVLGQAKKNGIEEPVVFYVPRKDSTQVY